MSIAFVLEVKLENAQTMRCGVKSIDSNKARRGGCLLSRGSRAAYYPERCYLTFCILKMHNKYEVPMFTHQH